MSEQDKELEPNAAPAPSAHQEVSAAPEPSAAPAPSAQQEVSLSPEAQRDADAARKAAASAGQPAPWWTEKLEHDYDGIQEANVDPPNWWKWLLYGCAVAACLYFFVYEGLGMLPVGRAELEQDQAKYAAIQADLIRQSGEVTPEQLETLAHDPATRDNGRAVYVANCAVCHKDDGSGQIGPNLTDKYWLHGGSAKDILTVVQQGVPDKGMPAWVTQLGVDKTQAVTAYVLSLRNKNLPGKAPQGEITP